MSNKRDFVWCMFRALPLAFAVQELPLQHQRSTSENKSKSSIFFWMLLFQYRPYATVWFLSGDCTTCVSEGNSRGRRRTEVWFVLLHKDNCFNGNSTLNKIN